MAIGRTNAGGGGAALNFKVVPGLTQPGTASENTIWVKTERIGAWYFSATQPENMQEWDVWFQTGTESATEFNALRKNGLQVYPLSAKQYVSGALVNVEAKSYQNGEWADWIIYFIRDGVVVNSENWTKQGLGFSADQGGVEPTVTQEDGNLKISVSGTWKTGIYYITEKEDLTDVKSLHVIASASYPSGADVGLSVWDGIGSYVTQTRVANASIASTHAEYVLDVSNLNGKYNIGFYFIANGTTTANITDFWKE